MENNLEKLKYPIGRFALADDYTLAEIEDTMEFDADVVAESY